MGEQLLRDKGGKVLGRIRKLEEGRYELRDPQGNPLGVYDQKRDRTLDRLGNVVGYGNLLPTLLAKR
jgi:hypothetical protein